MVQVVLEEDGCEIEDDTPLDIFPKGQLFMLLEMGQQWCPPKDEPSLASPGEEQNNWFYCKLKSIAFIFATG